MIKLTVQFRKMAIPMALSCIISAKYNHVIVPLENSKNTMNRRTIVIIPIDSPWKAKTLNRMRVTVISKLNISISVFLPAYMSNTKAIKVAMKLTTPIKAVIEVGDIISPLNKILE